MNDSDATVAIAQVPSARAFARAPCALRCGADSSAYWFACCGNLDRDGACAASCAPPAPSASRPPSLPLLSPPHQPLPSPCWSTPAPPPPPCERQPQPGKGRAARIMGVCEAPFSIACKEHGLYLGLGMGLESEVTRPRRAPFPLSVEALSPSRAERAATAAAAVCQVAPH